MNINGNEKIVIFSRNEKFLSTVSELITNYGFIISKAGSIESLFNIVADKSYDVLVINNDFSRLEFLNFYKKVERINPDIVKIILTTKKRFKTAIELINLGAFDYVMKPFRSEELFITLKKAINVRKLKKERDIYNCIFENSVEGIYLTDINGNYIIVNNSLANIFGYRSTKEFLEDNKNRNIQSFISETQTKKLNNMLRKKRETVLELEIPKRDGKKIWVSEKICPVYDKKGNLIFQRGSIEDVTLKKREEIELRKSELTSRLYVEDIDENTDEFIEIIDDICDSYKSLECLFINFIKIVVSTLDERCPWTKGHSLRVAEYSEKIGKALNIPEDELKKLKIAGLLHDIGKIMASESLLSKPSRYTEEELRIIRRHPIEGAQILNRLENFEDIIPYVKYHHEWFNGSGYPEGLKGDKIPFYAKILHLAECYDSMTTKKPYNNTYEKAYALEEIKRYSGIQFDPDIAKVAIEVL